MGFRKHLSFHWLFFLPFPFCFLHPGMRWELCQQSTQSSNFKCGETIWTFLHAFVKLLGVNRESFCLNAGPYSIAVASTIRIALSTVNTQLQDYVLPSAKTAGLGEMVEADDEVVEGASRVSLRCPVRYFSVWTSLIWSRDLLFCGPLWSQWGTTWDHCAES